MALGEAQLHALWSERREMSVATALTVASGVGRSGMANREPLTLTGSRHAATPADVDADPRRIA